MEKKIYITEEEREKCRKVVNAFAELYEQTDTVVADAGRFGFVKLECYYPAYGFDDMKCFRDSEQLFDGLWADWFDHQVLTQVLGTPLAELDFKEIYEALPKQKQKEIMAKKRYFEEKSGIKNKNCMTQYL